MTQPQADKILQFLDHNPQFTNWNPEKRDFSADAHVKKARVNERGNMVTYGHVEGVTRSHFDFKLCEADDGWEQFDTQSDAPWFGSWLHRRERLVVTYAEGDVHMITCPSEESFTAELQNMCDFHGKPPPAFVVFDYETGVETHVFTR